MKQLKLDAFYGYRFLSELNFSPDGKQAAVVVTTCNKENNGYDSSIYLMKEDGAMRLTAMDKERGFVWEDDTHMLFPSARTDKDKEAVRDGGTVYYRICTAGGEALPAFKLRFGGQLVRRVKDTTWLVSGSVDPKNPDFYSMTDEARAEVLKAAKEEEDYETFESVPFYFNGAGFTKGMAGSLFLVDIASGEAKRITSETLDVSESAVIGDTVYYVAFPVGGKMMLSTEEIYAYDTVSGDTKKLTDTKGMNIETIVAVGDRLLACMSEADPTHIEKEARFFAVDTATGALTLVCDNRDSLFNSTGSDCRFGRTHGIRAVGEDLYFVKTMRNDACLYRMDASGAVSPVVERAGSVDDFDATTDGRVLVIGMFDGKLQEVYTAEGVRRTAFNTEVLADTYVAPYEKMTIQSRGWDIDGWVLKPKDYDPDKTYPAILDIHGGPRTVYGEIFYHEMQVWANMGYFVFFCNPVGGSGRGWEFADITNDYGGTDFANIMDFTDAVLAKYPQIDPARVGCTGGSYGGFMSNWILGHTDRFAAIATQRSISNWVSFYGVSDIGYFFTPNQLGHDIYSDEGLKRVWAQSPLKYINDMKTPTLFIHSNEDYRCPMEQGMQLFTALKDKGVPARFVYFKGENHELSRSGKPKHREKRLTEITNWMEKYTADKKN